MHRGLYSRSARGQPGFGLRLATRGLRLAGYARPRKSHRQSREHLKAASRHFLLAFLSALVARGARLAGLRDGSVPSSSSGPARSFPEEAAPDGSAALAAGFFPAAAMLALSASIRSTICPPCGSVGSLME